MVRSKSKKKEKGDDAFKKTKQKTGRKKLAPVTDTRAEVHARSLFISTSSAIAKAQQQQKEVPVEDSSSNLYSSHKYAGKQTVKELLRGTSHYKGSQRASSYTALARLLLQEEKKRQLKGVSNLGATEDNVGKEEHDGIEPMEKLRAFSAALEAMTDTEDDVRRAALGVLQALFRENWVCPMTIQEEQLLLSDRGPITEADVNAPRSTKEAVWMLISAGQLKQQKMNKSNNNDNNMKTTSPSSSSEIAPAAAALSALHSTQNIHLLYQAERWWKKEIGVVRWVDHPEESGSDTTMERFECSGTQVDPQMSCAARKVALENVSAILHTIFICLTHAFHPIRWTGIELLESLLLLLQLHRREACSGGHDEDERSTDDLFRDACRLVCQKQHAMNKDIITPVSEKANAKPMKPESTMKTREAEKAYVEEIWMLQLLRRVSQLVLRTPHLPVLASLVDALLLSSKQSVIDGWEEESSPGAILSTLRHSGDSGESIVVPASMQALWSSSAARSVAASDEWFHPHLVESALENIFLSPWATAWKELMDKRLDLLRQEASLARAVALARVVGTVMAFLQVRQSSPCAQQELLYPSPFLPSSALGAGSTGSTGIGKSSAVPLNERKFSKKKAYAAQEQRQKLLDLFVRRVPITLATLLLQGQKDTTLDHKDKKGNGSADEDTTSETESTDQVTNEEQEEEGEHVLSGEKQKKSRRPAAISPTQLRHRFALAQALAMVAAPMASRDDDAWKLLHQYFTLLFPPLPQVGTGNSAVGRQQANTPDVVLESLSGAMDVMLLVLRLHRPTKAISVKFSQGGVTENENWDEETKVLEREKQKKREEEEEGVRQRRSQSALRIIQRTLLFAPAAIHAILQALKQYSNSGTNTDLHLPSVSRGGNNLLLRVILLDQGRKGKSSALLSSSDGAILNLLLGTRQLLISLSLLTSFHSIRESLDKVALAPSLLQDGVASSTSVMNSIVDRSKTSSGAALEVFRSFHRVWHLLPRLLFSLRLQVEEVSPEFNETDEDEPTDENSLKRRKLEETPEETKQISSPSQVTSGVLSTHPALMDMVVYSILHVVWTLLRQDHFVLRSSSQEARAVALLRHHQGWSGGNADAVVTSAVGEEEQNCAMLLRSSFSSLKGFIRPPPPTGGSSFSNVVHGILSRCSLTTRKLAQRIAFYLGDLETDYMLPVSPSETPRVEKEATVDFSMLQVGNHLADMVHQEAMECLN